MSVQCDKRLAVIGSAPIGSSGVVSFPASAGGYSGIVNTLTVDSNPGVGGLVYEKSNGNYAPAQANSQTTMDASYLMLETGTGPGIKALALGLFNDNAGAVLSGGLGDKLYVSRSTSGEYTNRAGAPITSGDVVQCVGRRLTADVIHFNPSNSDLVLL